MNRLTVHIVLDGAVGSFDKRYSYFVPDMLSSEIMLGCRVTVPFGRGNITKQGLIVDILNTPDNPKIKSILSVIDKEPIINEEMLGLCEFMKERLFCTYYDAFNTILPAGLKLRSENFFAINTGFSEYEKLSEKERAVFEFIREKEIISEKNIKKVFEDFDTLALSLKDKDALIVEIKSKQNIGDKTAKYVKIINEDFYNVNLTDRQKETAETICALGSVSVKEVMYFTGVTMSVINALENKGVVETYEKQIFRIPNRTGEREKSEPIELNEEQRIVYKGLKERTDSGIEGVSLLYGITGSGKTSVYMKLVDDCIKNGKGVIVMVPEIALTPQVITLFSNMFGNEIAIFHSAMSLGQRMDEYNRVRLGMAKIAIGTRSAVFAPFKNLGLIIMDEEQEHTYKSEKSPRFNARDIAKYRAKYHKCQLVLASATPSIESYSMALSGKYSLFELNNRYGNAKLPIVSVVDMKQELETGNTGNISRHLAEEMQKRLDDKKQIILLLNRRGHNTHISCPNCGYVAKCEDCSVSLTYHSANKRLMCHYCGHSEPVKDKCPECGCEFLVFKGAGTQKLQEEISVLFPQARILRMDADSTISKDSYATNLNDFAKHKYDIMIGTQMVAKGLDFPNVDLVGVIGADRAFYSDDYRGFERTFSLLTQVVGRAGRSGGEALAVIQTLNPDDSVITLSSKQDYKSFYEEEILTRRLMIYPPYCDICMLVTSSEDNEIAFGASKEILNNLKENTGGDYSDIKLIILGPMAANIVKVNGKYRYRIIIKCKNSKRFRDLLRKSMEIKPRRDLSVYVDINPETIL